MISASVWVSAYNKNMTSAGDWFESYKITSRSNTYRWSACHPWIIVHTGCSVIRVLLLHSWRVADSRKGVSLPSVGTDGSISPWIIGSVWAILLDSFGWFIISMKRITQHTTQILAQRLLLFLISSFHHDCCSRAASISRSWNVVVCSRILLLLPVFVVAYVIFPISDATVEGTAVVFTASIVRTEPVAIDDECVSNRC